MTRGALTFANGAALREKHERDGVKVFETRDDDALCGGHGDAH